MVERSDKYSAYLSSHSGLTSIVNGTDNKFICPTVSGPIEFDEEKVLEMLSLELVLKAVKELKT